MKRLTILQPSYLPWIGYFDQIDKSDVFVFFDEVLYTKNDWRNRNRIKTSQGTQWLTIPVEMKHRISEKVLIKDVKMIDKIKTISSHLQAIYLNYKKARYFNEIYPFLE